MAPDTGTNQQPPIFHYAATFRGPCGEETARFRSLSIHIVEQPPSPIPDIDQLTSAIGTLSETVPFRALLTRATGQSAYIFWPNHPLVRRIVVTADECPVGIEREVLAGCVRRLANQVLSGAQEVEPVNQPPISIVGDLPDRPQPPTVASSGCGMLLFIAILLVAVLPFVSGTLSDNSGRLTNFNNGVTSQGTIEQAGGSQPNPALVTPFIQPNANQFPEMNQGYADNACVWSSACPPNCPQPISCIDHGPIRAICNPNTGVKFYYLPGHQDYNAAHVGESLADRFFCREIDALAAGFQPAP